MIALDAGHGGYDGGAVGRVSGTPEKGLNLDVARRLAAILEAQGAQVVMTRTDDYALCRRASADSQKVTGYAAPRGDHRAERRADGAFHPYERIRRPEPERAAGVLSRGLPGGAASGRGDSGGDERNARPQKEAFRARRRLLYPDAGQAERAGGMRVFIQRRRGGASADGGLPPAGRTGDCAGHMGMGESAGGKAGGAPGGGARRRGGSGDVNVKRLVNLQGEMYSSVDEAAAFFDEIWLDSLWTA